MDMSEQNRMSFQASKNEEHYSLVQYLDYYIENYARHLDASFQRGCRSVWHQYFVLLPISHSVSRSLLYLSFLADV